jgi:hypothetical protein
MTICQRSARCCWTWNDARCPKERREQEREAQREERKRGKGRRRRQRERDTENLPLKRKESAVAARGSLALFLAEHP